MGAWGVTSPWLFSTWHLLIVLPPNLTLQRGMGRRRGEGRENTFPPKTQKWRTSMFLSISYRTFVAVFPFARWETEKKRPMSACRFWEGSHDLHLNQHRAAFAASYTETYTIFPPLLRNKHLLLLRAKGQVKGRAIAITLHLLRLGVQLLWAFHHRSCGLLPFGNCLLVVLFI